MNFIDEYRQGQKGMNRGLTMGAGLANIDAAIGGVHKKRIYAIASPAKVGKTCFVDMAFMLSPWLAMTEDQNVEWIYYSFEIDRVSKEFDLATFFLNHDYGVTSVTLDEGVVNIGGVETNIVPISPQYLKGMIRRTDGTVVTCKKRVEEALMEVYKKRIIPLLGEWDSNGNMIKQGSVRFFTARMTPDMLKRHLLSYAEANGHVYYADTKTMKVNGYVPNDSGKHTIVIIDHMRKLIQEQGLSLKQTVDKASDIMVELRNFMEFTFVPIVHTNRSIADTDTIKSSKDMLYPGPESIKDTGNISEDADYVITMFNPNDDRYGLKKHFGLDIRDSADNLLYPNMRTLHLVESRHCVYPQHFRVNMFGNLKKFEQLKIIKTQTENE